jgi:hypothetical protein
MQAMQTISCVQRVAELAVASAGARAGAAVLVVDTGFLQDALSVAAMAATRDSWC